LLAYYYLHQYYSYQYFYGWQKASSMARRGSIYTAAYRRERRRRFGGWILVVLGSLMAAVHMVAHLGRLKIVGYQDLLIGYPMAAILVLAGFMVVGMTAKA
jgi:peptidoglycan/LPS O-acetylase OafA/YrhL